MRMHLLFIFNSLWLNGVLIFLLTWLLVSILVYQRHSVWMKGLHQWIILPAFMIFGERRTTTNSTKSTAEIERFNAYLEESTVLQKLQTALKKRSGIDLQQLDKLRAEVQRLSENYQHQSHYVTELSRKINHSVPSAAPARVQTIDPSPTPSTEEEDFISATELEDRLTEFYSVLKQIQQDTNQKIGSLRSEQNETQQQFEEEVDALSTAIGNISTAYDPRPALNDLNKKISTLELYVQEVQQELQRIQTQFQQQVVVDPTAPTAPAFERTEIKKTVTKQKDFFEGVQYTKDQPKKAAKTTASQSPSVEITADDTFTKYQGKMLFAAAPTDDVFLADQLVTKFVAKVTPYAIKVSTRDPQLAFYHLVTHAETVDYALQRAADLIESAMFVMGKGTLANAKRITMKAGELELVDGKWEIVKKAVLRFE